MHVIHIGMISRGWSTLTSAIVGVLSRQGTLSSSRDSSRTLGDSSATAQWSRVEYQRSSHPICLVDCHSFNDSIIYLLSSPTPVDCAILSIRAEHGLSPQIRRQVSLAHRIGVSRFIVFLDAGGISDVRWLELQKKNVYEFILPFETAGTVTPIICASPTAALGGVPADEMAISGLLEALDHPFTKKETALDPLGKFPSGDPNSRPPHLLPATTASCDRFDAEIFLFGEDQGGIQFPVLSHRQISICLHYDELPAFLIRRDKLQEIFPGRETSVEVKLNRVEAVEPLRGFTIRRGGRTVGIGRVSPGIGKT